MQVNVSEADGQVLDWLVTHCEVMGKHSNSIGHPAHFSPATNWHQAGPIIERELITICAISKDRFVAGYGVASSSKFNQDGPTPLIAAMRCYVATTLGDTVEVPEELLCVTT